MIVDPATPTPLWGLSAVGTRRMRQFAASPEMQALDAVWSSEETKAVEAADLMEQHGTRHLAVFREGAVVGILSGRDLLHPVSIDEF